MTPSDLKTEDFKRIRVNLALSQEKMAEVLKVNHQVVSHWETGFRNPSKIIKHIFHLLDTLDESGKSSLLNQLAS